MYEKYDKVKEELGDLFYSSDIGVFNELHLNLGSFLNDSSNELREKLSGYCELDYFKDTVSEIYNKLELIQDHESIIGKSSFITQESNDRVTFTVLNIDMASMEDIELFLLGDDRNLETGSFFRGYV